MRTKLLALLLLAPLPFWAQVGPAIGEGESPRPTAKRREVELSGVGMPANRSVSRTQPSTFAGFPEGETPSFSDYRLGAEDLISVYVMDAPEFSRMLRVDGNGTIRLPLVRTPIPAAGRTSGELEQDVASTLVKEGLLREPAVAVTVREVNSKPVGVSGAVRLPTVFQALRPLSVYEAISRAGGLGEMAGGDIEVVIPARDGLLTRVVTVPAKDLTPESELGSLLLYGGEQIRVQSSGKFYMVGGVAHPGPLPISNYQPMTLLQAISISGGTTDKAGGKGFILRAADGRQRVEFDMKRLLNGKETDLPLKANDLVYIPDSRFRRYGDAMATSAITSLTYGVMGALLWR
jgi:polysaccharide export outer membrane protein